MMDTTGLAQLDRRDFEACFDASIEPDRAVGFLRNLSLHVATRGDVFGDGHTVDGPGGRWRARQLEQSLAPGPRRVVRFTRDGARLPPALAE